MAAALEDELGDIVQKARDGKSFSQGDLARAVGLSVGKVGRVESCEWIPEDSVLLKLAGALDLHGPSLVAIAREKWVPEKITPDPDPFDITCLNVYMGLYPVKCYLLTCRETRATAVIDTGGDPEAVIKKVRALDLQPEKILLTHTHPDHAGGVSQLECEFQCPTWLDKKEPRPSGSRNLQFVEGGDLIPLGKLKIEAIATRGHTPGGISYRINRSIISGDAIFAGSMGRANSSWSLLFNSITQNLLTLPEDTRLYPGHGPATTVGEEKQHNPFFCGKVGGEG